MKRINFKRFKRYKFFLVYVISFIVLTTITYLTIPIFFNYEKSKSAIEKKIYNEFNIVSSIQGEIKYRPLPSPRIKISKLLIKDFLDNTKNLGKVEKVVLKIPFKKLINLKNMSFDNINLRNAEIDFNLNKIKQYNVFFSKKFNSKNIKISNGHIKLFDKKKLLGKINEINLKFNSSNIIDETTLTGKFLNDDISINLKDKKTTNPTKIFTIKFPSLKFRSSVIFSYLDTEETVQGNGTFYYNNSKLNLIFDWKDSLIKIKKGSINNDVMNGKIYGDIKFLPFFDFDLNVDLKSLNFGKIVKNLAKMNKKSINNLFELNNKINGSLNLNVNKIYSSSKLVKSLESRIQFMNKDILVEQMLIDLGKLGAADLVGMIKNEKNFSNFIFKKNLFIDNAKYFYSKFGIYNKKTEPESLYVAGSFNLNNAKIFLSEVVAQNKLSKEDINYYQDEFNQILLEEGYKTFFNYFKLKEFVNLVVQDETNQN